MTIRTAEHTNDPGGTYYAYPAYTSSTYSLANWSTHRVQLVELSAPNTGVYQASVDDAKGSIWYVFEGSSQPSDWGDRVAVLNFTSDQIVSTQTSHTNQLAFILADTTEALTRVLTVDQLAALVSILGIPSSGSTPETPTTGVLAEIKGKTDLIATGAVGTILPVAAEVQTVVAATHIRVYTAETTTVVLSLQDAIGAAIDTTSMTLEMIFESGTTDVVISNASINKFTNGISFAVTSDLNSSEREWNYALRKTNDEAVLQKGVLSVQYAPNN